MCEPLKGKIDGCEEAGYVMKIFQYDDVKSAVEGLKKDLLISTPWKDIGNDLCKLVDKWFEDVI